MTFNAVSEGIEFLCEFREDLDWNYAGNVYTCWNAKLTILTSWTVLESVRGQHISGRSNIDVRALHVNQEATKLENLPRQIENFFPNLVLLEWRNGNLKSVTADDFRHFPELINLNLGVNKIVSLDGDLFKYTPKIKFLSFFYNKIMNVGTGVLANLNDLSYVYFGDNPCTYSWEQAQEWANTTQGIRNLSARLAIDCPPLPATEPTTTTTTTDPTATPCDLRCTLNEEVDRLLSNLNRQVLEIESLKNSNNAQNQAIEALTNENLELREAIDNQNDWILKVEMSVADLEQQFRELLAIP